MLPCTIKISNMVRHPFAGLRRRWWMWRFSGIQPDSAFFREDRDLILTGIPRSGTSLLCAMVNNLPNACCVNEVFYRVDALPISLARVRYCLVNGWPIPNKRAGGGRVTTNTLRDEAQLSFAMESGEFDSTALIATKVNVPYLNALSHLIGMGFRIVAMAREPLFTIASWNTSAAHHSPEYRVTSEDLHRRWATFDFETEDRLERQAQIWLHYASLILQATKSGDIGLWLYENVVQGKNMPLELANESGHCYPRVRSLNLPERYADEVDLDLVQQVVNRDGLQEVYSALRSACGAD